MNKPLTQLYFYLSEGNYLACRASTAQVFRTQGAQATQIGYEKPAAKASQFLPVGLFRQAVEEALPLGLRAVQITGGEPLLHPDLPDLLDILGRHDLKVGIETNGQGVNAEVAGRLAELPAGACQITVGLQGADASTHDALTHQPGSFEMAVQSARLLASAGLPLLVVFTLARQNAGQLQQMVALADALGANKVRFNPLLPAHARPAKGPAQNNGHLQPLMVAELIAVGRRLERDIAPHTSLALIFDQPPAFRGLSPTLPTETLEPCSVMDALSVLPGGEVSLCGAGYVSPALLLGKLGVETLAQIWQENPLLKELRMQLPGRLEGTCTRCSLRSACLGHCVVQNYFQRGSFWGPYWFCDDAERAGLFPASRLEEI